ncbi:MAG: hypothetical protein K0U72_04675 [Gammaproteobacteria bacterium]|nr:hypothetical protein [Gammaproteobacteria bacterium]
MSFCPFKALFSLLLSSTMLVGNSLACMVPYSGLEYDSQIFVERIEAEENTFRITAPLKMNDASLGVSILKWLPYAAPSDGKQPYKEITMQEEDGLLVGVFSAPSKEYAYEITVELWYLPELDGCPTGANAVLDGLLE